MWWPSARDCPEHGAHEWGRLCCSLHGRGERLSSGQEGTWPWDTTNHPVLCNQMATQRHDPSESQLAPIER
ncbi:hypothetical protein SCA03_63380 [Streptomyces cacaoi]|uniref:Uncharacterized protein n=1 Tax=Streptomyces cacaoi TaxID=1898 RepID=A0A4Y3RAS8_STRCI|nr:hypothetical protein SCA03_63380 [Streptomyces cacaoi]